MDNQFENMHPESRIWIYQSNRSLEAAEIEKIQADLDAFTKQWASHSRQLKASARVINKHFLVLAADETQADASGCSIDSSVQFVKQLGAKYNLNLFDRMTFAYADNETGEVELCSNINFGEKYKQGEISDDTKVFDTLVKTKADLDKSFLKPLKESWHARFV